MALRAVNETAVEEFTSGVRGTVIRPGDAAYDEARAVWNGLIDKRPAFVVRCAGVADVIAAVTFAREHDLPLSVRGGGHNVAGSAVVDDGLVVDLSEMNGVRVDPDARTVRAEGGATWADVDRETQAFGLATPGGVISDTGIGGLTLGGGFGHLTRKYGLSSDNLVSVDVVTADGELLTASEDAHEDLFWAVRGGGGNFGVVTSFEYRLHEVGPEVMAVLVFHPGDRAAEGLRFYREFLRDAPDEVSALAFYAWIPEDEEFPAEAHGEPALVFLANYAGGVEAGEAALRPLRAFAEPIADFSGPMPYTELQSMLDAEYPDGRRYYWKSINLGSLDDEVIDRIVEWAEKCPSKLSTVDVWGLGGAVADADPDATAFPSREVPFLLNPEANWDDPAADDENIAWVREFVADMREFSPGGLYVNFPGFGEEGEDLVRAVYGDHYDRLVAVKNEYDPENLFRSNQNVKPTV